MRRGRRIRDGDKPSETEKVAISAACEKLIAQVLLPRFLPAIRPTEFNYPVNIAGRWHGNGYRFVTRYRSGYPENKGKEFDAPFARLEYVSSDCFDISWFRHTGTWFRLHRGVTLAEAIQLIGAGGVLSPPC